MKVYVGYDTREDIAYQVCEHSIKRRNGQIEVIPLKQKDLREKGIYYQEKLINLHQQNLHLQDFLFHI